jgi:predicted nucleotidyltransferase
MQPTHKSLYESFASHGVWYLLIGGAAVILHGSDPHTLGIDIFIEPTPENAARALQALRDVGFGTAFDIEPDELLTKNVVIFDDVIPVDLHTHPPGLDFGSAWRRGEMHELHGVPVMVISLEDLIASKEAAGRPQDLEDVAWLREIEGAKP